MRPSVAAMVLVLGVMGQLEAAGSREIAPLTLATTTDLPTPDWVVGKKTLDKINQNEAWKLDLPGPEAKVATVTLPEITVEPARGPGFFDAIDYNALDLGPVQADEVYLLAPTGRLRPFAVISHQYLELDDEVMRLGYGTGAKWTLSKNVDLGTEVVLFPRDREWEMRTELPGGWADMQFFTRLEIRF